MSIPTARTWLATCCLFNARNAKKRWKGAVQTTAKKPFICRKKSRRNVEKDW
jgi:hypothetical protein